MRNALYVACTFMEAGVITLANRVRRKWGRKWGGRPQISSTDVYLRLFLLHALGRQPKLRITCGERTDGAGAQAHTMMSAINFARAFGHTYVHTPFAEIDHGDRPMPLWVEAWENLFNLGDGEEPIEAEHPRAINYSTFHPRLFYAITRAFQKTGSQKARTHDNSNAAEYLFHPFLYYSDGNPDSYMAVIPELRKKYYRNKSPVKNDLFTVAVHMRRGDVGPNHGKRFTPTEAVAATIRQVKSILDGHQAHYRIALYSQGEPNDFSALQQSGAELFLDADAIWSMQQLIEADILIMSKSSFSYVAALISDGIKLYEPFWHSPLSPWITRTTAGKFNSSIFAQQLQQLFKSE